MYVKEVTPTYVGESTSNPKSTVKGSYDRQGGRRKETTKKRGGSPRQRVLDSIEEKVNERVLSVNHILFTCRL